MVDNQMSKHLPSASDFPDPHLVQGISGPVIRGAIASAEIFSCENCGNVLIENYIEECCLGIEIKCYRCKFHSKTPYIEPGEILPRSVANLGYEGAYVLDGTVDLPYGAFITCSQAIEKSVKRIAPQEQSLDWSLNENGLSTLIKHYDDITGNKFDVQYKIASRDGFTDFTKLPFARSIYILRSCLSVNSIDLNNAEVLFSLSCLRIFTETVGAWREHPRFGTVAREIGKPDSFFHTISQLLLAHYLYRQGLVLGLSLENIPGTPNPDLYIRTHGFDKFYLEVKTNKKLHFIDYYSGKDLNLEGPVKSCITASLKQINKNRPGALMIFSTSPEPLIHLEVVRCAANWLKRYGRDRPFLAAVIAFSISSNNVVQSYSGIDHKLSLEFEPVNNPYYHGDSPFCD